MGSKIKQGREIIAFHYSWNISDVSDGLYQNFRPAVYVVGDDYFCCPPGNGKPPAPDRFVWKVVGEHYGRKVYISELADMNARFKAEG
jgi:hypothetical protein